ncbi:hypothetical protein Ciccas_008628 [Cichlidogyrus casuarinus]|uniref:Rho-related GTP-binding protein RhoE n=1 Tax=Cichlidogyrus casuarinus TaxID=1844966 RepID=A0ABD2Q0Z2_9PLAT
MVEVSESSPAAKGLVVVGDGMVGKTALLFSYSTSNFNDLYQPTVFEAITKDVYVPSLKRCMSLSLWDTGGQEEFEQIRVLMYPHAEVVVICYAIDNKTSLDNVVQTWVPEIEAHCPNVPYILVGCKSDCRCSHNSSSQDLISPLEAIEVAHKTRAAMHIECSSKTRANVDVIFEMAAELILSKSNLPKSVDRKTSFLRSIISKKQTENDRLSIRNPPNKTKHDQKRFSLCCASSRRR